MGREEPNQNSVEMSIVINGKRYTKGIQLPNSDLSTDDAIGDVGFRLGRAVDFLSKGALRTFNEAVEEIQNGRKSTR